VPFPWMPAVYRADDEWLRREGHSSPGVGNCTLSWVAWVMGQAGPFVKYKIFMTCSPE